jgi:hypothetical protein
LVRILRSQQILHGLGLGLAFVILQGMDCSEHRVPPALATIHLKDIHLEVVDPATGTSGVFLAWPTPADGKVTHYEVFQSFKSDSMGHSQQTLPATDSPSVILAIPDSGRPMTLYYAVRAVYVEATGQKLISDTLAVDSITILPSFSILSPSQGSIQHGRTLQLELATGSQDGILLKMILYEKIKTKWAITQKSCFPITGCDAPIFGGSLQRDSLILQDVSAKDTLESFLCMVGTESFEEDSTGLNQSLGCSRFVRVNP